MIKKINLLLFPFILLSFSVEAKTHTASFEFQSPWNWSDHPQKNYIVTITINKIPFTKMDSTYTVPVNQQGLDTIVIKTKYGASDTLVAKIKPGKKYFVSQSNEYYEISPFKIKKGERLVRVVAVNKDDRDLYFSNAYCFMDMSQLKTKDTTFYAVYCRTAEWPDAVMWASICSKDEPDIKEYNDEAICNKVKILFLENEKYAVVYDFKKRKMNVVFEGYSNGKEKIKF